jgi:hypothetical protein
MANWEVGNLAKRRTPIFPEVMSHRTPRHIELAVAKKVQEGEQMQVDHGPADRVLTMSTPLWPDNRALGPLCLPAGGNDSTNFRFALVMSSTQLSL